MRAIAQRIGMEPSTLNRQARSEIPVQTLMTICRAYKLPLLDMFVAVGYVTPEEAEQALIENGLAQASDAQLMHETLRRVHVGEAGKFITRPLRPLRPVGGLLHAEREDDRATYEREVLEKYPLDERYDVAAGSDRETDDEDVSTP